MVVLDADSVMTGDCLCGLVRLQRIALNIAGDAEKEQINRGDCLPPSTRLQPASFECSSQVEPGDFTSDLTDRLRALYAQ